MQALAGSALRSCARSVAAGRCTAEDRACLQRPASAGRWHAALPSLCGPHAAALCMRSAHPAHVQPIVLAKSGNQCSKVSGHTALEWQPALASCPWPFLSIDICVALVPGQHSTLSEAWEAGPDLVGASEAAIRPDLGDALQGAALKALHEVAPAARAPHGAGAVMRAGRHH